MKSFLLMVVQPSVRYDDGVKEKKGDDDVWILVPSAVIIRLSIAPFKNK